MVAFGFFAVAFNFVLGWAEGIGAILVWMAVGTVGLIIILKNPRKNYNRS
jgi:small-conductance mechanosensitive channel